MTRWFRFYDEALNDPKILKLSDKLHRVWIGILCIASKNEGTLPSIPDMGLMIRMKPEKLSDCIETLIEMGLIDKDEVSLKPHNWNGRQYKSDVSTGRVKRFRNGQRNVSETPPDTEQSRDRAETETDLRKGADAPKYVFDGSVVRLNAKTFGEWKLAFPNLDLLAELTARDAWLQAAPADDQKNWFISTSQHLANRNMRAKQGAQVIQLNDPYRGVL